MPDIIHLLPDNVANQIAAGEVIQRPSSVVKELMENAIDAGATSIQLVVKDAGKTLVQVIDNGKGMSETDARLSFERHATSKIQSAADLFALHTMGFRGEALASIAAVAQVELRTRMEGQELGTCLQIEGGRVVEQMPVSCPVGANFAVRNIFFNVPARRKFLKSDHTELSNILSEFQRICLAHPTLNFRIYTNGSLLLDLPAGNLRQMVGNVFGRKLASQLLPVDTDTELVKIHGFVGVPESARKKSVHQYFFINNRYMRHPSFAKAVMTAYARLIPDGEQVPFFLAFETDPARIDVNVHPTKTEIKFQDEQAVWQILLAAVREALGKAGGIPSIDFDTQNRPDIPAFNPDATNVAPPDIHINPDFNPFQSSAVQTASSAPHRQKASTDGSWAKLYEQAFAGLRHGAHAEAEQPTLWPGGIAQQTARPAATTRSSVATSPVQNFQPATADLSTGFLQYEGHYIVFSVKSGLMFVDQHRAHIRVLYDSYLHAIRHEGGVSQGLLFPQELSVSPADVPLLSTLAPTLKAVGFDLQPADGGTYQLRGVPSGTEGLDPAALLQGLLADVRLGNDSATDKVAERLAASLARKAALPLGVVLSQDEMAELMRQLFASTTPAYTPDGQPVLTIIPAADIEARFSK